MTTSLSNSKDLDRFNLEAYKRGSSNGINKFHACETPNDYPCHKCNKIIPKGGYVCVDHLQIYCMDCTLKGAYDESLVAESIEIYKKHLRKKKLEMIGNLDGR
jgi:Zn finger protein HypA/HybF involved in hydrogenase expression